jgi:uncharacterized protein involved in exopolysaccharide biosynthesis/Mrp family chromosome partitioning ATPase
VQDVVFILMRHRWKILVLGATGLLLAAALYFFYDSGYEATAKLLVRYVMESRGPEPVGDDRWLTPGRSQGVIEAEVHILTSLDTLSEVARIVGPDRILADPAQKTNQPGATRVIAEGLDVQLPGYQTSIMVVTFRHPDRDVAIEVLAQVVKHYLEKHLQVHRAIGTYEFLTRQTDDLRTRLLETEAELKAIKARANVVSIEESRTAVTRRLEEVRKTLGDARVEMAAREARLRELDQIFDSGSRAASTNTSVQVDGALVLEYKTILDVLAELRQKHQQLSSIYTQSNALVRLAHQQIEEQTRRKHEFEQQHPEVRASALVVSGAQVGSGLDSMVERTEVAAVLAKVRQLEALYAEAQGEAEALSEVEVEITELQRQKELDETNYRYFSANLEKAKIDEALDPSKIPNISTVQEPVLSKSRDPRLKKICLLLGLAGIGLGVGLAFLIELVLDQTYKRAEEVEEHAGLPVLLSIPLIGKRVGRRLAGETSCCALPAAVEELGPKGTFLPAVSSHSVQIKSYCEALRDRMMLYFQLKKMVHKPKLVAVTGCSQGAGSSTLASGLAASLSETGGGKVLLVDMNLGRGAVHPFHNGDAVPAVPAAFSEDQFREQQVQENLYLASAADARTRQALMLPKQFGDLIPRMRASDYDYIIFDMPPISQTAATLTLSSFMDQVLMVIESEKSPKESVRKAASLLQQSGTSVFGVFNKGPISGNGWLQPKL